MGFAVSVVAVVSGAELGVWARRRFVVVGREDASCQPADDTGRSADGEVMRRRVGTLGAEVDVGAELARPGARVDVIGQAQDGASNGAPGTGSDGQMEAPAQTGPENGSTIDESAHSAPTALPSSSPSSSNQESPGIQKPSQSLSQGMPVGSFGQRSTVLCTGARVIMIQEVGEGSRWAGNKKVTLITLAIPAGSAILVVGAATNSTLGIALSP